MKIPTTELLLWYGAMKVGRIPDAFATDATWYGTLERTINAADGPLATRLIEFMEFCIRWNERSTADPDHPPDAAEFDRFNDVIKSGLWSTQTKEGVKQPVTEAPVFFPGNEVSWRTD
jgi:hypothetical protein